MDLLHNASWECTSGVSVIDGKIAATTGNNYLTVINSQGPYLNIHGDFAVHTALEVSKDWGAVSLYGVLGKPGGEWWQGIKRLDFGVQGSEVFMWVYDGTSPNAKGRNFRVSGIASPVQIDLRKAGSELVLAVSGQEVGRIADPGLFPDGRVYLGLAAAPQNSLKVHALSMQMGQSGGEVTLPIPPVFTRNGSQTTLRSLADSRRILIGAQVEADVLRDVPQYADTIVREFNTVTANQFYFGVAHPSREAYSFCAGDYAVGFAKANDMQVRGHTLVWHNVLPDWLSQGKFTRDELTAILRDHILTVVGRYRGRVAAWDVVNEAINDDGSLRDTIWLRGIGPEYIDLSFRWAHEADPQARLFYNDYGGESLGRKSDTIYTLVQGMLQRGVPINGVGLQMHLSLESPPKPQDVASNIKRLGALGLDVHITEMDVRIKGTPSADNLTAQARVYGDILGACLSAENCRAFVTWGFTDRYSWIPSFFPGYGAALLFDESYHPKPAYKALMDALTAR